MFEPAERVKKIPPYLFMEINKKKNELISKGVDIIDLGIGDPDIPTPPHIIEALCKAAKDPKHHKYPPYQGTKRYLKACADWMDANLNVKLDPDTEVLALIGSKEGIVHGTMSFANPGDVVLVPSPGYPPYLSAAIFSGAEVYFMPLEKGNNFLPDLDAIPKPVLKRARILFLNYPNNPTSACASAEFFEYAVKFAKENNIIIFHDAAYISIYLDGLRKPSILETSGAKDVALEFHSLSKTYNMTGWRIGFCAGNKELIESLGKFKSHVDSSLFGAIQEAGITAMNGSQACVEETRRLIKKRRDAVLKSLEKCGLRARTPHATFYIWAEVPKGFDSKSFAIHLLEKSGVVVAPGTGFGDAGEGFFRISLTCPDYKLDEAMSRIEKGI